MTTQDTKYEQELLALMDQWNFWTSIDREEKDQIVQAIKSTKIVRRPISIKMPLSTLERLKSRASKDDIPYQTLMNSIIKKWLDGRLVERK